ncbi:MAG: thermonuclease family protein [Rhodospirillales bacterium]|nr:thermonuclease family protein [Rhodospirillales bacterium]
MLIFKRICLIVVFLGCAGAAWATPLDDLKIGASARVIEVVDGDTVILDAAIDDAIQVRLVGLQAPKLPLGRKGFRPWPLAEDSKYALEVLTLNKRVTLRFGGARMDRHGRHLAHLFLDDGTWVQGQMLERGMARVYTFPDNRAVTDDMYALERQARDAGRGIWAHPFYAVRAATPEALDRLVGTFQVIEGRVLDAAQVRGTVYLNFGGNWRDDFTVTLDSRTRRDFLKSNRDPLSFEGKYIRVRGWLKKRNGPALSATHPAQIELIDPESGANQDLGSVRPESPLPR